MMQQYHGIKKKLPDDVLLFFRLGDFYELFFEDAKEAASILNVALTRRNDVPMCGVPHHAAEGYIGKLVKSGKRVAIAEQTTDPQPGKIVEREVRQVISAGTIDNLNLLDANRPNYLAAVCQSGKAYGLAHLDHSTGEFRLTQFNDRESLVDELNRIAPAETLYPDDQEDEWSAYPGAIAGDGYTFLEATAKDLLCEHFNTQSLDGFGCAQMPAAVGAAGAILHYVKYLLHRTTDHIKKLTSYTQTDFVQIDAASQRNLDLVESRSGNKHTLLHALNRTSTPMGSRLLRHWILHPIDDIDRLMERQDFIAALIEQPFIHEQVRTTLKQIRDIERSTGRLAQGSGNARDLLSLATSLDRIPELKDHLTAINTAHEPKILEELSPRLRDLSELSNHITSALVEEPPASLKDGGLFADGFHEELDTLRAASREGKQWLAELQEAEAERTGIKSLKVKYNAVFGYFIEITKANLANVPDDYVRKQTTANAERFITEELKLMEDKILGADERAKTLEYTLFIELRGSVLAHMDEIQDTAAALAIVDVLSGLAETARAFDYRRPHLTNDDTLTINGGRHPVLDQTLVDEKFVPNDTLLDRDDNLVVLITGPNMAGKSTYIRQVALLTLMAQIGSFIPADEATIGLVDRIFTRVGASDDLARGQSTFMVEMNETSLIINNATSRSLVILDEIGRGTATFDGLSIAWAVAEHLHDIIGARTLFATHYHELTRLSQSRKAVQNCSVAVREWNDRIIFLRKIVQGSANRSYGIQVARLAGLPPEIIHRAKDILAHLETQSATPKARKTAKPEEKNMPSLGLFEE
ncbi:DNA mismatch repair protein MutS [Sulfuriroseicoccus oceanibius]|uniref:DNA mismatch repair protein MutS n=2 Tax=Sulfuriroseicoccus oceanibius TaxID=2707525 RepID=A0A6B3LFV3_9BACT|nr:DNA mismatch repair protein MutS [Sulfuriroseicoccus oceanibius]